VSISLVPKDAQQPPAQLTTRQYITLDTTSTVIVDIEQLAEARDEARRVSRRLHNSSLRASWTGQNSLTCAALHTVPRNSSRPCLTRRKEKARDE